MRIIPKENSSIDIESAIPMPNATDLEQVVLGACMIEKDAIYRLLAIISDPNVFYSHANRHVFIAILSVEAKGMPIDILTVTQELNALGTLQAVGGGYYLSGLTERVASAANMEFHARILVQKHLNRETVRVCIEGVAEASQDADCFENLDNLANSLMKLSGTLNSKQAYTSKSLMQAALDNFQNPAPKIATGMDKFDMNCPIKNGELTIIGARPGMGKTALALCLAYNMALAEYQQGSKKTTMFFSLEMSQQAIATRLLSIVAGVSLEHENSYKLNKGLLDSTAAEIAELNLITDVTPQLKLSELKRKALQAQREHGITAIFLDYLQLMHRDSKKGRSDEQIEANTQGLKVLANTLNVPIICLAQLNRGSESKDSAMPTLSALRGSGAIEQDADNVLFIYRPEYYNIATDINTGESTAGMAQIVVAKRRNGSQQNFNLHFKNHCTKFQNAPDYHNPFSI